MNILWGPTTHLPTHLSHTHLPSELPTSEMPGLRATNAHPIFRFSLFIVFCPQQHQEGGTEMSSKFLLTCRVHTVDFPRVSISRLPRHNDMWAHALPFSSNTLRPLVHISSCCAHRSLNCTSLTSSVPTAALPQLYFGQTPEFCFEGLLCISDPCFNTSHPEAHMDYRCP